MNKLIATEDGAYTVQSAKFGVNYHSIHGAIQETNTVFIEAGLSFKAQSCSSLNILGIGFGTGLNAFMTYLEAQKMGYQIDYVGVEAYPIAMDLVEQLNYPILLDAKEKTAIFRAMHEQENCRQALATNFTFEKKIAFFEDLDYQNHFDIIYYDAFAPSAQAELWETAMLSKMFEALRPNGVLTTYCAKGAFKRCLKAIGFEVEGLPGPKGKREMTRALKPL